MFDFIESSGILDSFNELHLLALQYVYLPRINASLCEFTSQWNHRGIRTVGHQTPLAMWYTRLLTAPEEPIATNWQTYGIDYDGPLTDIETDNNVVVPESHIQLTDHQLQELQNRIDPLSDDGNNGIYHCLDTVTIIDGFTEQ